MNNNEPLDNIDFKEITAQHIIEQLKSAGFHEVYEIKIIFLTHYPHNYYNF